MKEALQRNELAHLRQWLTAAREENARLREYIADVVGICPDCLGDGCKACGDTGMPLNGQEDDA